MRVEFVLSIVAFVTAAALTVAGDHGLEQWLSLAITFSIVVVFSLLLRAGSRCE